jgi:hypothetical protein
MSCIHAQHGSLLLEWAGSPGKNWCYRLWHGSEPSEASLLRVCMRVSVCVTALCDLAHHRSLATVLATVLLDCVQHRTVVVSCAEIRWLG